LLKSGKVSVDKSGSAEIAAALYILLADIEKNVLPTF
jgi:hypothetical protein